VVPVVGAFLAVAALAGCGSSSKNSSTATTSGSVPTSQSSGTTAVAGSRLSLGAIVDETGSCLNGNNTDQRDTLNSWAAYTNSHGGLNGHPVSVTVLAANCDPGKAASDAQQLINQHVLAIVDGTLVDNAFEKAVDTAKIPVICSTEDGNAFLCQADANFFPSGTTVLAGIYGNMYANKAAGSKSYALVYCSENPSCKQAVPVFQGFAKQLNLAFPTPLEASLSAPSYTAQCLILAGDHADSVFGAGPPSDKLANDCAKQGYHPRYAQSMGTWLVAYLSDANLNGATGDTGDVPWTVNDPSVPATVTFQQVEGAVLKASHTPYNVSQAYAAALLFAKALANAPASATTQDVYNGLYALHGETLGGFSPPLTFTSGKPTQINCFFVMSIESGHFAAPRGATPACEQ
jgi:branched-chain amino acid transport system substrate-binding protein